MISFSGRAAIAIALTVLGGCVAAPVRPEGGGPTVAPGEVVSLGNYYWIRSNPCASRLNEVSGMSVVSGNTEGLELSLQRGVSATPWQCPQLTVPAARITVRQTLPVSVAETRSFSVVVSYDTMDGPRISRHLLQVNLVPAAAAVTPAATPAQTRAP